MIESLIEKHRFFRRLCLLGAMAICGWTTYQMFVEIDKISTAATAAYGIATGLLGLASNLYFRGRQHDEDQDHR